MADVAMPRLSDSMEEGTILKWLKSDGDSVEEGEELVEIETDKANMTYEADEGGTLSIVAQEGDTLAVGETIARIGEGGEESAGEEDEGDADAEPAGEEDADVGEDEPEQAAGSEEDEDSGEEPAGDAGEEDEDAGDQDEDAGDQDAGEEDEDEAPPSDEDEGQPSGEEGPGDEEPAPDEPRADEDDESGDGEEPSGDTGSDAPEDDEAGEAPAAAEPEPAPADGGRVKASPVARRMARELGLDLSGVQGTGPGGRIVKADVEALGDGGGEAPAAAEPASAEAAPEQAPEAEQPPEEPAKQKPAPGPVASKGDQQSGRGEVTKQELTRLQQTVARRMAESKATAPDFVLTVEVDMSAAVDLRTQFKGAIDGPPPSYNDFIVKASALALRDFPRANGAYRDGAFELYSRINVGVAVAGQDALVVATVFDADKKGLGTISTETRALAERVRAGTITPPELASGTFTVSNLGMYGIRRMVAVLNPPQAAILGVGEMAERPTVEDGQVVVKPLMELTLTCDHRILYGADAAEFLARIRAYLEAPLRLAL